MTPIYTVILIDHDAKHSRCASVVGSFTSKEEAENAILADKRDTIMDHWYTDNGGEFYELNEELKYEWLAEAPFADPVGEDEFEILWDWAGFGENWTYVIIPNQLEEQAPREYTPARTQSHRQ